jgi:hypothetical protein
MVMASRPDVATASLPVAAVDVVGLAQQLTDGVAERLDRAGEPTSR